MSRSSKRRAVTSVGASAGDAAQAAVEAQVARCQSAAKAQAACNPAAALTEGLKKLAYDLLDCSAIEDQATIVGDSYMRLAVMLSGEPRWPATPLVSEERRDPAPGYLVGALGREFERFFSTVLRSIEISEARSTHVGDPQTGPMALRARRRARTACESFGELFQLLGIHLDLPAGEDETELKAHLAAVIVLVWASDNVPQLEGPGASTEGPRRGTRSDTH